MTRRPGLRPSPPQLLREPTPDFGDASYEATMLVLESSAVPGSGITGDGSGDSLLRAARDHRLITSLVV